MIRIAKLVLGIMMLIPVAGVADSVVPEPENYKMEQYRSPVPATLSGATVVDAGQSKLLHEQGNIKFIDVLPAPKQPEGMKEGDIWLPQERLNIPGSIWLADVGYGVLSDDLHRYFVTHLNKISKDGYMGLLFYCLADCWMSWNAAKRALELGFSDVYWFPGGVDDWSRSGFELAPSIPAK